jgi:5-histidylcysteine sulfoxide synthase/putative 4-mercaptohistidine N1-methyltranferase
MRMDSSAIKKTPPPLNAHTAPGLWQNNKATLMSMPNLHFADLDTARQQIRDYFLNTFDTYQSLFECLKSDDAYYVKPIALRHPLIFYFGHTATFFINKLLLTPLINERIDPHLESIFAVGVDEMSWDDLNDTHYNWPSVNEVRQYRDQVRATVLKVIEHAPLSLPIDWHHPWWAIIMGIEHERIHLETSSVLMRQHHLQYMQLHPKWCAEVVHHPAPTNQLIFVPEGQVHLNKTWQNPFYGWDNEYGEHTADVNAFHAAQFLCSNREFLAFVDANGYQDSHYWSDEGWAWKVFAQANAPTFWRKRHTDWLLRLMLEEVEMPWDWPVEVNYHEAQAFCRWKSKHSQQHFRLPTEDEWHRIYQQSQLDPSQACPNPANIELRYGPSPCSVDIFQQGDFFDVQGNVWQWTETAIYPFEGFEVHPIYDDFTTPTFDGQHNIIKGGSWISAGNEALYNSRYAFRRHFFQHAGFRYVVASEHESVYQSNYETDQFISQYLEFQYGPCYFGVENFAQKLVAIAEPYLHANQRQHALDLGCATGRASFELAAYFEHVIGLDFSARFIQQAIQLKQGHSVRYTLPTEGDLVEYKVCQLKDFQLQRYADRVDFYQADACNLKPQFSHYDFILAANLIDRLHHPKDFLKHIHERLNIGGVLMLSSPYTWLEEHTAKAEWLGGFKQNGESLTTLQCLEEVLLQHFEYVTAPMDVAFVIRETARKYQHTVAQVTLWRRIH